MKPTIIRASSLPSYFDCSRRTIARGHADEIKKAGFELRETHPSAGGALGTAVHSAAEYMLREKFATGEIGNLKDATDLAVTQFNADTSKGAEWDDTTPNAKTAAMQITRMAYEYSEFAKNFTPQAIELSLEASVGDNFLLSGHIDLMTDVGEVRDLKTGALERPYQAQLGAYSLLAKSDGREVTDVRIDWLPRVGKMQVQDPVEIKEFSLDTCEKAGWHTIQMIKRDLMAFRETGEPWSFPANNMSMMCSNRYCSAHGTKFCDMGK